MHETIGTEHIATDPFIVLMLVGISSRVQAGQQGTRCKFVNHASHAYSTRDPYDMECAAIGLAIFSSCDRAEWWGRPPPAVTIEPAGRAPGANL